jgi:hypothetical protein
MREMHRPKVRWLVLAMLGAVIVPPSAANADTQLPVWTCRASAAYLELDPLIQAQRVEPVLANGYADRDNPDTEQCANADAGVHDVDLPEGPGFSLIELNDAFAATTIDPPLGAARQQTVTAGGGVSDDLTINLGNLEISVEAASSEASAACVNGAPALTATSAVAKVTIGELVLPILANGEEQEIDLSPLALVRVNEQVRTGTAASDDESLTQRAVLIELLNGGDEPVTRIVIGESKVDRHGAVCAATTTFCPAGTVAQDPNAFPVVCILTVAPPCPAGSTPNGAGACIVVQIAPPPACPVNTVRDPTGSGACILLVQRPCPAGSTADPTTRVCVLRVNGTTGGSGTPNGGVGGAGGPAPTCGRLVMRFVKGKRILGSSLTNRFGTRVLTRGRLVTCGSNPKSIVGARIDVVHVLPGNKRRRKTGLRSRAGGLLTLILPIDLRSRKIEYAYRPDLDADKVTSRVTLNLTVKSKAGKTLR